MIIPHYRLKNLMLPKVIELHASKFSAVTLTVNSTSLIAIKKALAQKVNNAPLFFQHIPVLLTFNDTLKKLDLNRLQSLLSQFNIQIAGVVNWRNNLEKELIISSGLPAFGSSENIESILPQPHYLAPQIVKGNISTGQFVYAKNRDIIVHGDVEKGAEVAADGNIHIYGKLLGRALAGVNTDTNYVAIYAQYLDAEFISVLKRNAYQQDIPIDYRLQAVRIEAEQNLLSYYRMNE